MGCIYTADIPTIAETDVVVLGGMMTLGLVMPLAGQLTRYGNPVGGIITEFLARVVSESRKFSRAEGKDYQMFCSPHVMRSLVGTGLDQVHDEAPNKATYGHYEKCGLMQPVTIMFTMGGEVICQRQVFYVLDFLKRFVPGFENS